MTRRSGCPRPAQRPLLTKNLKFVDNASADAGSGAAATNSKLFKRIQRPAGDRDALLSYRWEADYRELDQVIPLPRCRSKADERVMASILYDCILSAKTRGPEQRISYSRSKEWWSDTARYRGSEYTYTRVRSAVEALVAAGYLVDHWIAPSYNPACPPKGFAPRQSSFRPADFLADLPMVVAEKKGGVGVVLKNSEGGLVGYRDTERTERDRRTMETINHRLRTVQISLDAPHEREGNIIRFGEHHAVNVDDVELYRVFNGGWTMGGRMYGGWWQNVSKDTRAFFRIDGEKTVEEDYAQIHPRMLYATLGIPHPEDAYRVPGYEDRRPACKVAWNTLLNADSNRKALYSLAGSEHFNGDVGGARALLQAILAMHKPIARYFFTGVGLRLQYFDSQVAKDVVLTLGKKGIACLPVHDSFIVQERHRDILVRVMNKALRKVTGKPGFVGDTSTESTIKVRNDLHMGVGCGRGVAGCGAVASAGSESGASGSSETIGAVVRNRTGDSGSGNDAQKWKDMAVFKGPCFRPVVVGKGFGAKADRKVLEVVDDIGDSFFPDADVVVSLPSGTVIPVAVPSSPPAVASGSGNAAATKEQSETAVKPSNAVVQSRCVEKRPLSHPTSARLSDSKIGPHSDGREPGYHRPWIMTPEQVREREEARKRDHAEMTAALERVKAERRRQREQEAARPRKRPLVMPPRWMSPAAHDRILAETEV